MASNILTVATEVNDLRSKWRTLSVYGRFEQSVVTILTLVIAVIAALAAWQLLLAHTRSGFQQ
jgi:small-conductance mechanosensitive channel